MDKSKDKHLKSVNHKIIDKCITRRYFIQNPNSIDIDEIMRKSINIYFKKHQQYSVSCVLKLLTNCSRKNRK